MGNMYFNKLGIYRILSASVNDSTDSIFLLPHSKSNWLSIELLAALNLSLDTFFGMQLGFLSKIQNAAPSRSGTLNIRSIVFTGEIPTATRPAYDSDPIIPAPPVPDDHVDITFLRM